MSDQSQQQEQVPFEASNAAALLPTARPTRFHDLPLELRAKIWCLTFHTGTGPTGHRRVDISFYIFHNGWVDWPEVDDDGTSDHSVDRIYSREWPQNPIALHICRDSRQEALRNYHLLFDFSGRPNMPRSRPFYYNPNLDIIYLDVPFEFPQTPLEYSQLGQQFHQVYGFLWVQRHAPLDIDAIQSLEIHASPFDLNKIASLNKTNCNKQCLLQHFQPRRFSNIIDTSINDTQINCNERCLLHYFRRLRFLNIVDTESSYCSTRWWIRSRQLNLWYNPQISNTDIIRAFIKERQKEDLNWLMPSIRFVPSNKDIQEVLQHWPEDRREGKDG
jgi:hypothetical protein